MNWWNLLRISENIYIYIYIFFFRYLNVDMIENA